LTEISNKDSDFVVSYFLFDISYLLFFSFYLFRPKEGFLLKITFSRTDYIFSLDPSAKADGNG